MAGDSRYSKIAVVVPAYNPDGKLVGLLESLKGRFGRIVLVNDGSTEGLDVLAKAKTLVDTYLEHPVNRGKGAALKTAFAAIPEGFDAITADADGQHRPDDIAKIADVLPSRRRGLVLGVRDFKGKVPLRSRFGNSWTRWIFFAITRLHVRDTQTGLRGIPSEMIPRVAALPGDRYEYEMAMLADARRHEEKPLQIPIDTVYIEENKSSHFNPVLDTVRIYRTLVKFCLSSVLSFAIDNLVFLAVVAYLSTTPTLRRYDILVALVLARLVSSNFNFAFNRYVVFRERSGKRGYAGYWALVVAMGAASYALTEGISAALDVQGMPITIVKICVETFLFVTSYLVQKRFIFKNRRKKVPLPPGSGAVEA